MQKTGGAQANEEKNRSDFGHYRSGTLRGRSSTSDTGIR